MDLAGSVAVITGGGSGIGEAVAKDLANDGVKIVLGDMDKEGLDRVVNEIKAAGGEAAGVVCNITKDEEVEKLMDTAMNDFGAINIVFANAGIIADSLMINLDKETGKVKRVMTTEQFQSVINVNLVGTFITIREAVRRMVDNGCKGLVAITSSINKVGQVGQLNYSSTKVSVALWPKILSAEFHMRGIKDIRVIGIAPGYAATPILTGMNQKALEAILKDVHIGRLVEPEELASTLKHAVVNEAIDGTTIEVTGGVTYGPRAIVK